MDSKGQPIPVNKSQPSPFRAPCPEAQRLSAAFAFPGQANYRGFVLYPYDANSQYMVHTPGRGANMATPATPDQARRVGLLPQGAEPPAAANPPSYPGLNYPSPGFGSQPSAPTMATVYSSPIERFQQEFTSDQQRGIESVLGGPMKGSIWLAYRLAVLKDYELNFIIDNSSSMNTQDGMVNPAVGIKMTRLEEACCRLSDVADLLAHVPVKGIKIRSFSQVFPPIDTSRTPAEIAEQMKECLHSISRGRRLPETPLYPAMLQSINEPTMSPRIIYVFNDGEPNTGGSAKDVCQLLKNRNAEMNPVCLVACTDNESAIGWMNEADYQPNVHVVNDFQSEMREVKMLQGSDFPFTEGFYLMSTLLGPIDPLFDKADEIHIFDHPDYQEICGRSISSAEYEKYRKAADRLQNGYAENNDGADGCLIL